jgi:cold shock CspA family protein
MTGRIEAMGTESAPGFIRLDSGIAVRFALSEVIARHAKDLTVGQLVTFEMERGTPPRAFNVCVEKQHYVSHEAEKRQQPVRYLDFEQSGNIRAYKFERLLAGGETQTATVSADLSLFLKHAIGLQDGPSLCLRVVTEELNSASSDGQANLQRRLTDEDMLSHLARQPAERKRYGGRPGIGTSHAAKHVWRGTGRSTTS